MITFVKLFSFELCKKKLFKNHIHWELDLYIKIILKLDIQMKIYMKQLAQFKNEKKKLHHHKIN